MAIVTVLTTVLMVPSTVSATSSGSVWDGYLPATGAGLNQTLTMSLHDDAYGVELALVADLWSLQYDSTSSNWDYGMVVTAFANSRHVINYDPALGGSYPCNVNNWLGHQLPNARTLGDNEGFSLTTLGLPFWFYGAWYYQIWVTENGWLTFDSRAQNDNGGKWTNPSPPSGFPNANDGRANAIMAPLWKDFHGGTIRWGTYGTGATYLDIAWDGVMDASGNQQYFMVSLHLTRATDDRISSDAFFYYCSVVSPTGAKVGMEDQAGKRGVNAGLPASQTYDWFDAGTSKEPKSSVWTGINSIKLSAHEYYKDSLGNSFGSDPDAALKIVNVDDIPPEPGGININVIGGTEGAYVPPGDSGKWAKTSQVVVDVLGFVPLVGGVLAGAGFAADAVDAWRAWTEAPPDQSSWQEVPFDSTQSTGFFRGAANEGTLPDSFPWNSQVFNIGLQPAVHWKLRNPDSVANRGKTHYLDLWAEIEITPWNCVSNCKSVILTQPLTLTLRPGLTSSNSVQYFEWFGRTNPDGHSYNIRPTTSYELQGSGKSSGYSLESSGNGDTGYKMLAWSSLSRYFGDDYQLDGSGRIYVDGLFKQIGPTSTNVNLYVIGSYYERPVGTPHNDKLDNVVGTFPILTSADPVSSWVPVSKQIDMGTTWSNVHVKFGIGRTVDQASQVQAVQWTGVTFTQTVPQHRLDLSISPSGSGTTNPTAGTYYYSAGSTVTIYPYPSTGYKFDYWLVDGSSTYANFLTLVMDRDHVVSAIFTNQFQLSISAADGGSTSPPPGTYTYTYGTSVEVSAVPPANYVFDYWTLDATTSTSNPISVLVNADRYLTAHFKPDSTAKILTISISGVGQTSPPPGTYGYSQGTPVTVSASETDACYVFYRWFVDGVGQPLGANPITVTMDVDHSALANFKHIPHCTAASNADSLESNPANQDPAADASPSRLSDAPSLQFRLAVTEGRMVMNAGSSESLTVRSWQGRKM